MDADDWLASRRRVETALRADPVSVPDVVAALALLARLRADLDSAEEQLITLAREHRVSWRQVAEALGLRSRQAAEQRWLRLRSAGHRDPAAERSQRQRQQRIDTTIGTADLRARVVALHSHLARRPDLGPHAPAAQLARRTLAAAADAPPGPLVDLARWAARDLRVIPPRVLGPQTSLALSQLRTSLSSIDSTMS